MKAIFNPRASIRVSPVEFLPLEKVFRVPKEFSRRIKLQLDNLFPIALIWL